MFSMGLLPAGVQSKHEAGLVKDPGVRSALPDPTASFVGPTTVASSEGACITAAIELCSGGHCSQVGYARATCGTATYLLLTHHSGRLRSRRSAGRTQT
jgi:hypothetical protein